ncbi:MAG: helix-turn-helix transcriptional regulator [Leptospirales bacterium]
MSKFKDHLKQKLKDPEFKEEFERQRQLSELAIKIQKERTKKDLSQSALAKIAGITQQQLSKIENAVNSNIVTYLKVLNALDYSLGVKPQKKLAHV